MKHIVELNFSDNWQDNLVVYEKLIPVALLINNKFFCMKKYSWIEFLKVFYFEALKDENILRFVERHTDVKMFNHKNLIFSNYDSVFKKSHTKISSNVYLKVFDIKPINNLVVIKRVLGSSTLECRMFFGDKNDTDKDSFKDEKNIIKREILATKCKPKIIQKNVGHYIASINAKILTEYEKFINDFHKKFNEKIFIGDIVLNEHDEDIFDKYMKYEMHRISNNHFNVYDSELFSYGLVRYAMKYYGSNFSRFWSYAKDEYQIEPLTLLQRTNINDIFEVTMKKNNKKYYSGKGTSKGNKKIDNISMHCFITDHFANQLFDYLFEFWRLDLERNFDNLNGNISDNESSIDTLINEITQNNLEDENPNMGIKRHTAMAVETNTRGCKTRLRNILYFIDNCFWNLNTKINSNSRIYKLLEKWMNDKKSLFQKEYIVGSSTRNIGKGEQIYSKPVINYDMRENLLLKLPRQIIKNYEINDKVFWKITIGNKVIYEEPELLQGKIRIYATQRTIKIEDSNIFKKIECQLWHNNTVIYSAIIRDDSMRIISNKQYFVENYEKGFKEGTYFIFTENNDVPTLLGKEVYPYKKDNIFVTEYDLEDGDALILPNDIVIQIGKKLQPGLFGVKPVSGVFGMIDQTHISVYSKLPKIMFKAEEHQIPGTSIFINENIYRINEFQIKKILISDDSELSYGYMIDLSNLKLKDDVYDINIKVPLSNIIYKYKFIYIENFKYNFIGSPYIFKDRGTIEFLDNFRFDRDLFESKFNLMTYDFTFDENSSEHDSNVIDRRIIFNYHFLNKDINLYFDIPALYWKYKLDKNKWNVVQPSYISNKKIPDDLYLSGPFDFLTSLISLDIDDYGQETFIESEKTSFDDVYRYRLEKIKSWISDKHDCDYLDINLKTKDNNILFTKLICRSIVKNSQIFGNMEDKCIYGSFDIDGDSEYSVTVKYNNEIIGEDIPLKNNEFSFEYDFIEGDYEVELYEIVEDDSGFDSEYSFLLKKYKLKLINPYELSRYYLKLLDVRYIESQYQPLKLKWDYQIRNVVKENCNISAQIDLIKLDNLNVCDMNDMQKLSFYSGTLTKTIYGQTTICNKVLIIFYDKSNISKYYLLGLSEKDNQYYPFLYNTETHELLLESDGSYQNRKKLLATLFITDFAFESIMEEL